MKKQEIIIALITSLGFGVGILLLFNEYSAPVSFRQKEPASIDLSTPIPATKTMQPVKLFPTITETSVPVQAGIAKGKDVEDVLMLYSSDRPSNFDINFCKIAEYYGLLCKTSAIDTTEITDEMLRDPQGTYYRLIGVSATTLLREPSLFSEAEIKLLESAISTGGANLFISKVNTSLITTTLFELTNGDVGGVTDPQDSQRGWIVSSAAADITREFSGQVITSTTTTPPGDFALSLKPSAAITTIISAKDDSGAEYPIFIRWKNGSGSIFVDSGGQTKSLDESPLKEMFYDADYFSNIVPLMMAMRYAVGEEAWHRNLDFANLTLDDPTIVEPFNDLSYTGLLREMEAHNFHTTIAFIPAKWKTNDPVMVDLFRSHPDRYSLVQHGNNHDGYEFYKYTLAENDPKDDPDFSARPLADQEADIVEGLRRMGEFRYTSGIPFDQVMVYPQGISPELTLALLKKYNYLATVNAQSVPLDAARPPKWDYGVYPAEMYFGNFPMLTRRHPGTYLPFKANIQPFIFDLFIDKPALFYSHAYGKELFADGIDAFDTVADQVNHLNTQVEWRSLEDILTHLYLEKTNDDGSMDVKMFTGRLRITNTTKFEKDYHISKEETLNIPIYSVTVNGQTFPCLEGQGLLKFDVGIPSQSSIEINIQYGN